MDARLRQRIVTEAAGLGINVEESFYNRLDFYVERFFRTRESRQQLVIQAYLGQAGLRIARTEGKTIAQAEDVKAAVWLFHLPASPDDPCVLAGNQILMLESQRQTFARGVITENLRTFLNEIR